MNIDSLSSLDLSTLSYDDIRWQYGTHSTTSRKVDGRKETTPRSGVHTPIGDIRQDIWYTLAEKLIEQTGEQNLFSQICEHVAQMELASVRTPQGQRFYALQLHVSRIFDEPRWIDYLPFNRKYRPEKLEGIRIIHAESDCCHAIGDYTAEQIDGAANNTLRCIKCGRWAPFALVEKTMNGDEPK